MRGMLARLVFVGKHTWSNYGVVKNSHPVVANNLNIKAVAPVVSSRTIEGLIHQQVV